MKNEWIPMKKLFANAKESIFCILSWFVMPIAILFTCNHIDGGEFGKLSGIFFLPLLNIWIPVYMMMYSAITYFYRNNEHHFSTFFNMGDYSLISNLILDTFIGWILIVLKIQYSWIPFLMLIIASIIQISLFRIKEKEEQQNRLNYAKQKADDLSERINKWLQVCPNCGMPHKIIIKPKIIKDRIIYRVLMADDTVTIDNCHDVNKYVYYKVYWLEKEVNDYDGFNEYTW